MRSYFKVAVILFAVGILAHSAFADVNHIISISTGSGAQGGEFVVKGGYIYYSQDNGYISIIDKSNYEIVGQWQAPDDSYRGSIGLALVGDDLYCGSYGFAGTNGRVTRIDVSDPTNPIEEYSLNLDSYEGVAGGHMIVDGDRIFMATRHHGFMSIDISDPYDYDVLQVFDEEDGLVNWILRKDNHVIVGGDCLHIYDVSNPDDITFLGRQDGPRMCIDMVGDTIFSSHGWSAVSIFRSWDASDLNDIEFLGGFMPPGGDSTHFGSPFALTPDGRYAFVFDSVFASSSFGLYVLDVSDPTNMTMVDFFDTSSMGAIGGDVGDAYLDGDLLYVSMFQGDVVVFDVSDYTVIPEPATIIAALSGLTMIAGAVRRRMA